MIIFMSLIVIFYFSFMIYRLKLRFEKRGNIYMRNYCLKEFMNN